MKSRTAKIAFIVILALCMLAPNVWMYLLVAQAHRDSEFWQSEMIEATTGAMLDKARELESELTLAEERIAELETRLEACETESAQP